MGNQQQQGKGPSTNNNNNSNPYGIKKSQEEIHFNAFNVMKGYSNKNQMNSPYNQQQGVSPNPSQQLTRAMSFQPKYKYTITAKMLRDTFKTYAIDGQYLNKDRFDDAIESIFRFPDLPEMHYTYLSEKIFYLIDDSGDGKIQEDEFVPGLSNVLSDRNFRIKLSMMAMMTIPDQNRTYIEARDIQEFFVKSWIQAYKHLGWQIDKQKSDFVSKQLPIPTIKQFEIWATKYENQVRLNIENDLRENGIDITRPIDIDIFKKWLYKDHSLYIQYGHKRINVATSLTKLDEVKFEDDAPGFKPQGSPIPMQGQQQVPNSYPGFN